MKNWLKDNALVIGAFAGVIVAFVAVLQLAVVGPMNRGFDSVNQRFDDLRAEMNQRFDQQDKYMNARFDAMDERLDAMDERIDRLADELSKLRALLQASASGFPAMRDKSRSSENNSRRLTALRPEPASSPS